MSGNLSDNDIKRISSQLDAFYTAFRSYIYYSEVRHTGAIRKHESEFWIFQKYLLLYSLIVNWCEVFGSNAKNNQGRKSISEFSSSGKRKENEKPALQNGK